MKQIFVFLLFFIGIAFSIFSQDIDYVISDPNKEKKEFNKPSNSDSTIVSNPDYVSYILTSTAYTLEKKKIRLSGTDVIFIKGSYGITDNTMFSINISAFGTFTASLKQQIDLSDYLKLGLSASGGRLLFFNFDTTAYFGGGQAMITLGDRQDNITAGSGFYLIKSSYDLFGNGKDQFVLHNVYVGFQKQLGEKIYIIAEGIYFINYKVFTGSAGVKLIMGERMALNFGLMPFGFNDPSSNNSDIPVAIPLISFRVLLGRN